MNLKKASTLGLTVAAMLGFSLVAAPAAHADSERHVYACGPLSINACGRGGIYSSNTWAYSCDLYADGIGFRTYYWRQDGTQGYVDDPNGSAADCGSKQAGTSSNRVTSYQVCSKQSTYMCHSRIWV